MEHRGHNLPPLSYSVMWVEIRNAIECLAPSEFPSARESFYGMEIDRTIDQVRNIFVDAASEEVSLQNGSVQ